MAIFSGRSGDSEDRGEDSPFTSRTFIASAIVLAAVVVCGFALLLLGGSDPPSGAPAPQSTEPTGQPAGSAPTTAPTTGPTQPPATVDPTPIEPTGAPTRQPTGGPCRIPPGDQRIVSSAPTGVQWKFESSLLIPTRADIGPGVRDPRGVLSCFAHSPVGSVFAAMAVLAQVQDESAAARVIEARVAPGPGRNRALADARTLQPTPGSRGTAVQFVGFKIVDYTPGRTIVSIAIQTAPDRIGGLALTMRWIGNDWRLELRSNGSIGGDPDVLASLDGYVRFRGA